MDLNCQGKNNSMRTSTNIFKQCIGIVDEIKTHEKT